MGLKLSSYLSVLQNWENKNKLFSKGMFFKLKIKMRSVWLGFFCTEVA